MAAAPDRMETPRPETRDGRGTSARPHGGVAAARWEPVTAIRAFGGGLTGCPRWESSNTADSTLVDPAASTTFRTSRTGFGGSGGRCRRRALRAGPWAGIARPEDAVRHRPRRRGRGGGAGGWLAAGLRVGSAPGRTGPR